MGALHGSAASKPPTPQEADRSSEYTKEISRERNNSSPWPDIHPGDLPDFLLSQSIFKDSVLLAPYSSWITLSSLSNETAICPGVLREVNDRPLLSDLITQVYSKVRGMTADWKTGNLTWSRCWLHYLREQSCKYQNFGFKERDDLFFYSFWIYCIFTNRE